MVRSKIVVAPCFSRLFSSTAPPPPSLSNWSDPAARQYKYWNREAHGGSKSGQYTYRLQMSPESIQRTARILSLSPNGTSGTIHDSTQIEPVDPADSALHDGTGLPVVGAKVVGIGTTLPDFEQLTSLPTSQQPNVLFVSPSCPHASTLLPQVMDMFPTIEWVHCRSAGIDFIESSELVASCVSNNVLVTNAKGQFSSSLAEYILAACAYFAKDFPRLMANQAAGHWEKYNVEELRGKTMGIVGYGDIGHACAKLATVYGMRIVALRRHPYLSKNDPYCNVVYGRDKQSLKLLMSESDYIVCTAPSTVETRGMVNADAFSAVKQGAVFINVGRGPVIDEAALLHALTVSKRLKGAALDVFSQEPLPADHALWKCPNVLISPHNMDQTETFMHEATEFFLKENLPRFICGEECKWRMRGCCL
jgi:phosphoglycerate dehydrogenase-like enzyme